MGSLEFRGAAHGGSWCLLFVCCAVAMAWLFRFVLNNSITCTYQVGYRSKCLRACRVQAGCLGSYRLCAIGRVFCWGGEGEGAGFGSLWLTRV